MTIRWSEEDLKKHEAKQASIKPPKKPSSESGTLADALSQLGLADHLKVAKQSKKKSQTIDKTSSEDPVKKTVTKKKKARGTETGPIFQSLSLCNPISAWGDDWLCINMDGGRVLTYNDMFSILQYRKYEAFRYKKICRDVIRRAIVNTQTPQNTMPFFDGPTRLTLLRIGTKEMDRDALPVVFKYFLDTLKKEKRPKDPNNTNPNIIDDDNPNIIVDIVTIQAQGSPRLAMMLEKVPHWEKEHLPTWQEWVDEKTLLPATKAKVVKKTPQEKTVKKKATKKAKAKKNVK